jgi:hypothetical protein
VGSSDGLSSKSPGHLRSGASHAVHIHGCTPVLVSKSVSKLDAVFCRIRTTRRIQPSGGPASKPRARRPRMAMLLPARSSGRPKHSKRCGIEREAATSSERRGRSGEGTTRGSRVDIKTLQTSRPRPLVGRRSSLQRLALSPAAFEIARCVRRSATGWPEVASANGGSTCPLRRFDFNTCSFARSFL